MNESPACMGSCCLSNYEIKNCWNSGRYDDPHYDSYGYYLPDKNGLTTAELKILQHTKEIWEEFLALPDKVFYDNQEMQEAIHRVQQLIALRVARRVDTMVWRQPLDAS
jgi:hypothetical protein